MIDLDYLVVGTGRCGSVYMARLLTSLGKTCGHESLFAAFGVVYAMELMKKNLVETSGVSKQDMLNGEPIEKWFDGSAYCAESSWMAAPFIDHHCVKNAALIHNVRNPLLVVSSYVKDLRQFSEKPGNFAIFVEFIRLHAPEILEAPSEIERACLFWVKWNQLILDKAKQTGKRYLLARVEDGPSTELLDFLQVSPALRDKAFSNTRINSWKRREADLTLSDIPEGRIKNSFVKMAARLGYPELKGEHASRSARRPALNKGLIKLNTQSKTSEVAVNDGKRGKLSKKLFGWGNANPMEGMFDKYKGQFVDLLRREIASSNEKMKHELLSQLRSSSKSHIARGQAFGDRFTYEHGNTAATHTPGRLETYYDAHTEGPGIWKWRHYFDMYERHFSKFVGRKPTILEIGTFSGGSLGMWQAYFGEGCQIYGTDMIKECKQFESDSVRIIIGDQGDPEFWRKFKSEVPPVDIIIDDGSHYHEHQIVTLEQMLPHMNPGGVYLCEDIYHHEFDDYISGLRSRMNIMGPPLPGIADYHDGMAINNVQKHINSIHQYPLVTIIELANKPLEQFSCDKRGTHWLWEFWK